MVQESYLLSKIDVNFLYNILNKERINIEDITYDYICNLIRENNNKRSHANIFKHKVFLENEIEIEKNKDEILSTKSNDNSHPSIINNLDNISKSEKYDFSIFDKTITEISDFSEEENYFC